GGTVGALFGTGGPPYVIYLAHRLRGKGQLRATLSGVFFLEGLVRIASFATAGLLQKVQLWQSYALGLPVALLALYGGSHVHTGLSQPQVTKMIGGLLLLSCLSLFAKALV
ncbi:MAG TPA: sulfite exporter TauE/SafE family protein, partial [Thiobacillaceae bacterium]|nr:sulfite exporter TauE/SafE family protein [Thiobacillaceae bacterium]